MKESLDIIISQKLARLLGATAVALLDGAIMGSTKEEHNILEKMVMEYKLSYKLKFEYNQ